MDRGAAAAAAVKPQHPVGPTSDRRNVYDILECGVDWLTATCRDSDSKPGFDNLGQWLLHSERVEGVEVLPWNFKGFEGLACGGVAFGTRQGFSICRLSSKMAWHHWATVTKLATNVSRIDLQVTITKVPEPSQLIRRHHRAALDHVKDRKRPPQVDLRISNRTSPTLYLNTRQSDRFARVYDKGNESKIDYYSGAVRFEVQFNNRAAWSMSTTLARKPLEPAAVMPYVAGFFASRGVYPEFSGADQLQLSCPRSRSNHERRLMWIRTQVAPAVKDLIEADRILEVIEALGLRDFVKVSRTGPDGP